MFSRCIAWLLVALVALPFTAPFSTCDLSMLLSPASAAAAIRISISQDGRAASIEDAASSQSPASVLEEELFKDALLTAAVTVAAADVHIAASARVFTRASVTTPPLVALRL